MWPAARSRRLVFENADAQRRRPAQLHAGDRGRKPPIDDALRQMPQQIDDARPGGSLNVFAMDGPTPDSVSMGANRGNRMAGRIGLTRPLTAEPGGRYMLTLPTRGGQGMSDAADVQRKRVLFRCHHTACARTTC